MSFVIVLVLQPHMDELSKNRHQTAYIALQPPAKTLVLAS